MKIKSVPWESAAEIKMLSATVEEGLEYYVGVDIWKWKH